MPPEELARVLVEVGAVRPDQVREAARAADTDGFLAALTGPPVWDPKGGPALTPWQAERVRRATTPGALARALRVGGFLYLDAIGQGGMGRVYRGWDAARGQFVALKRVKNPTDVARRRLVREFKAMRRLDGNPAVVKAVELIRRAAGDVDILVMEYLNGGDLVGQVRAAGARLPWRRVVKWADMILQGLADAHARNLVHRDIKPANVLIHRTADRDIARLADWGVVKDIGGVTTVGTQAGNVVGTWRYMPPEQWVTGAGKKLTPAADLYALGGTLYYALTGRHPFLDEEDRPSLTALVVAHTQSPAPSVLAARDDGIPVQLDLLIQRLMAKDPGDRGTAGEVRAAFRRLRDGAGPRPAVPPPTPAPRPPSPEPLSDEVNAPPPPPPRPEPARPKPARPGPRPAGRWDAVRAFAADPGGWVRSLAHPALYPGRVAVAVLVVVAVGLVIWRATR